MKKKFVSFYVNFHLVVMCIIVLIPIILIVLTSFSDTSASTSMGLIPKSLTLDNYIELFATTNYLNWFKNTLKIAIINAITSVFIVLVTAWIMSRFNFKGRKASLISILLLSMFPSFLSMTAIYTLFLILGLLGKHISLIIIYTAGAIPFNVWLVKGYLDGIPKSLDEAAYIDGCSRFQNFFKIILPMSKPIITYCLVSQFMMPWMDYILPNILISKEEYKTLAVGLYSMVVRPEAAQLTMFAAGSVLIAIPITITFILFQKHLSQGIAAGANKG